MIQCSSYFIMLEPVHTNDASTQSTLCAIIPYFNPVGYKDAFSRYQRTVASLQKQGVPCITVEVALEGKTFELSGPDIVHLCTAHSLWHKEAAINAALSHIPAQYTYIAWIDRDILFCNDDWLHQASEALQHHAVIQLFENVQELGPDFEVATNICGAIAAHSQGIDPIMHRHYHGGAWAMRRDLLERHKLFDLALIGGGDTLFLLACTGLLEHPPQWLDLFNEQIREVFFRWGTKLHSAVKNSVGYIPGTAQHIWHGEFTKRSYSKRHAVLATLDTHRDIQRNSNGLWEWAPSSDPQIRSAVSQYFLDREEGDIPVAQQKIHQLSLPQQQPIISISWIRNEEDILESFVRHNIEMVDRMVIVLHKCTDSSKEILKKLKLEGLPVEISESNAEHHAQSETMTALLQQVDADWIVPLDADEFLCSSINVSDALQKTPTNTVSLLPWKTYVPSPKDNLDETDVRHRITNRRSEEFQQFFKVLIPNSFASKSVLPLGSHQLLQKDSNMPWHSIKHNNIWISHFPIRSEEQLRKKIINGWEAHSLNPNKISGQNFHWKSLYDRCKDPAPISTQELQDIALRYAITDSSVATPQVICDPITSLISVP